ncbi:MAG TPA: prepilin-type N-terminal cleavage/methylation domain-containing protein [Planctomycetota bacterium]
MSARRGFTLIEVLIAMGIFLFGVTALIGLFQYGGGMETGARARAALAPAVEPLVQDLLDRAWRVDGSGAYAGLAEIRGETVPGAADYRYDLEVLPGAEGPALRRAEVRFYQRSAENPVVRIHFLLPRTVPVERRLREKS